jgi:16S rRNA processing protein RimM
LKEPDRFLAIARIVKTQGRRGEVAAEILTDFPQRFEKLRRVCLEKPGEAPEVVALENAWPHKGQMILKFSGVDSISSAESLRGKHVLIPQDERVLLPTGSYYFWELAGCRVMRNSDGNAVEVGTVTDVERTGGVDLLRVERAAGVKRELLIPLAETICTRVDMKAKEIWIDPPEDLLDLNL